MSSAALTLFAGDPVSLLAEVVDATVERADQTTWRCGHRPPQQLHGPLVWASAAPRVAGRGVSDRDTPPLRFVHLAGEVSWKVAGVGEFGLPAGNQIIDRFVRLSVPEPNTARHGSASTATSTLKKALPVPPHINGVSLRGP